MKFYKNTEAFSLVEVLVVSVLLSLFVLGFVEGTQRMAIASTAQQNRNEALLQSHRLGGRWRAGEAIAGETGGFFLNGTPYTIDQAQSSYGVAGSSLQRLAITVDWSEARLDTVGTNSQHIKNVYLRY